MFLNSVVLRSLTGYKYAAWQIEWLKSHGYKYEIGADGHPRVLKLYIEAMLGINDKRLHRSEYPDLAALQDY